MIAIINTGKKHGEKHVYRLQINKRLITTFEHERINGLSECLKAAAKAAEDAEFKKIAEYYSEYMKGEDEDEEMEQETNKGN